MNIDILAELFQLRLPVRDDATPFTQSRQRGDRLPVSAELLLSFAQMHGVAALTENTRALHAGWTASHHENAAGLKGLDEFLRMPAAAIFFADRDVLRTHDLAALLEFRHADVAPDALADIAQAALGDLRGQEGVGDGRPRRADDVEHARAEQGHHIVRAGEAPVADNGNSFPENGLALLDEGCHPARLAETRGSRIFP